jgi:hypothetical protein
MAAVAVVVGQGEMVGAAEGVVVGWWPRVRRGLSAQQSAGIVRMR